MAYYITKKKKKKKITNTFRILVIFFLLAFEGVITTPAASQPLLIAPSLPYKARELNALPATRVLHCPAHGLMVL